MSKKSGKKKLLTKDQKERILKARAKYIGYFSYSIFLLLFMIVIVTVFKIQLTNSYNNVNLKEYAERIYTTEEKINSTRDPKVKEQAYKETGEAIKADKLVDAKGKKYNESGTIAKSQMLADVHSDVSSVVWRYDRWHHYVDYSQFKSNQLRLKSKIIIPNETNNYGMKLVTNWQG